MCIDWPLTVLYVFFLILFPLWLNHPSVSFFVGLNLLRFRECGWVWLVNKKCCFWGVLWIGKIPVFIRSLVRELQTYFWNLNTASFRFFKSTTSSAQNSGSLNINLENSECKLSGKYTLSGHPHSSWRRKKSKKIRHWNYHSWSIKHQQVSHLF